MSHSEKALLGTNKFIHMNER